MLVRRIAFHEIGGFAEGIRSGGDVDFSRRLQRGVDDRSPRGGAGRASPPRATASVPRHDLALRGRLAMAQPPLPGLLAALAAGETAGPGRARRRRARRAGPTRAGRVPRPRRPRARCPQRRLPRRQLGWSGVSLLENNKALVRRLVDEVVNARDESAVDELVESEFAETVRRWIGPFRDAFPDFRMEIVELIAEGTASPPISAARARTVASGAASPRPVVASRTSTRSTSSGFATEGSRRRWASRTTETHAPARDRALAPIAAS